MTEDSMRSQFSRPEGPEGREVLRRMNEHHAPLWDFCLDRLPRSVDGAVLDIGCGGGGLLRKLSERYPFAMLFGVDISNESLSMTAKVNSDLIDAGELELHKASVDDMPFDDGFFGIVTTIETYFFWPNFAASATEIARVLNPGGVLAIGSEVRYSSSDDAYVNELCQMYGMKILPDDQIIDVLNSVGIDAEVFSGEHGVLYRGVRRI